MYKYQCSKEDCKKTWTLLEGGLNGFTLTCPHCGKGRAIFMGQSKNDFQSRTAGSEAKNKKNIEGV